MSQHLYVVITACFCGNILTTHRETVRVRQCMRAQLQYDKDVNDTVDTTYIHTSCTYMIKLNIVTARKDDLLKRLPRSAGATWREYRVNVVQHDGG